MVSAKPAEYVPALMWFTNKVRVRLIDFPKNNDLSRNFDLGDSDIHSFMEDTIAEFNETDPVIAVYDLLSFPSQEILILGCIAKGLMALAMMHQRNDMPYNAGGISASRHSMGKDLERLGSVAWQKFRSATEDKKISLNALSIMTTAHGLGSDYGLLQWYNRSISY